MGVSLKHQQWIHYDASMPAVLCMVRNERAWRAAVPCTSPGINHQQGAKRCCGTHHSCDQQNSPPSRIREVSNAYFQSHCKGMAAQEESSPDNGDSTAAGTSAADSSIIADKYASGQWMHSKGQVIPERYPTNREVAAAIEEQVSTSVETYRNYRHVAWYTLFVALYLLVLYFQAASFKAGDVVATLKSALLPDDGSPYITFSSADQVLAYLGNKFVKPVYKDPVCGDGTCEVPWEGPAWGPFGCQADCGLNPNTTKVIVTLSADFTGHPSLSPGTLRAQVSWNLCMRDDLRQTRGLPPLCWFKDEQVFEDIIETQIKAVTLIEGEWYVRLDGDLAGKVVGAVYDASAGDTDLVPISLSQPWEACKTKKRRTVAAGGSTTVRRLLSEFTVARQRSAEQGEQLLQEALASAVAADRRRRSSS